MLFEHRGAGVDMSLLQQVLSQAGISEHFTNYGGEQQPIPLVDRVAVLAAMGEDLRRNPQLPFPSASEFSADTLCQHRLLALWTKQRAASGRRLLPVALAMCTVEDGFQADVLLSFDTPQLLQTWQWSLTAEDGTVLHQGDFQPRQLPVPESTSDARQRCLRLECQDLSPGYYQLTLSEAGGAQAQSLLIAAPTRAWQPPEMWQRRLWGVSVQLYSVSSEQNWGMGDFNDLQRLIRCLSARGADFLLLNPLHANALHEPTQCSPYSPADRRWLNPLYIAPEQVEDFQQSEAVSRQLDCSDWQQARERLRQASWLDHAALINLKLPLLAMMYQHFQHSAQAQRRQSLEDFVALGGEALQQYASWQAQYAPAAAGETGADAGFYCYLQWLAASQLQQCQQLALQQGMVIGLVQDLAVGSDRDGAEVQAAESLFCWDASIGAPPDPWAPQGQNWGMPPWQPAVLEQKAYAPFITLLRQNMLRDAALRFDHVMALARLWWCPLQANMAGVYGAYVQYPLTVLLAILRLESERQRCLVIGEDLGVVPPELRQSLQQSGVLSNLLFYFEKDGDHFRSPDHHPPQALAMLANHDVPPLKAWWEGSDLRLRRSLGLIDDEQQLAQALDLRAAERQHLRALLEGQWLLPQERFDPATADGPMDLQLAGALLRCLGRSQSRLVSVQLEDLLLLDTPVNVPGTNTEYRNWQRRLPLDMFARLGSQSVITLLEGLHAERA